MVYIKIFAWVILITFLLVFWVWTNKSNKKAAIVIGIVVLVMAVAIGILSEPVDDEYILSKQNDQLDEPTNAVDGGASEEDDTTTDQPSDANEALFDGFTLIAVDGGDLSGRREANVVVDIGYGAREYYAFTNEYGQLFKVTAKEIILQDDSLEPVLPNGLYYSDYAKVPGVESDDLEGGHVIADSLGGVSNAYNITPQKSILHRYGDQANMERAIMGAGGCTDFTAIITYPDSTTQIPSHYSFTYTLKGNVINLEFDNLNPDEVINAIE